VIQKAEIIAKVVREFRNQFRANDLPMTRRHDVFTLHDDRGRKIAEDEMTIAVFEIQMRCTDFRIEHQHGARLPPVNQPASSLQPERGG